MVVGNETWVNQSVWDKIPKDAQEAMQKAGTVKIFSDEEWGEMGQKLMESVKKKRGA